MIDKRGEVAFLADNFDIPPARAAALVASSEQEAEALAAAEIKREDERSHYGDVPVPAGPEEHEVPFNGGLQKTVLDTENERGRAGP